MMIRKQLLLAPACAFVAGCFGTLQPSTATFEGVNRPVLLGPVDRIGGGSALPTRAVGDYEGEAESFVASDDHSTTLAEDNASLVHAAVELLDKAGPDGDLRVTKVRAWAWGYIRIIKNKVLIKGNVVAVERSK